LGTEIVVANYNESRNHEKHQITKRTSTTGQQSNAFALDRHVVVHDIVVLEGLWMKA
jgi:hypothetical protein